MYIKKRPDDWKNEIKEVLESKVDEFRLLGYDKATETSIWTCLKEHVWKDDVELYLFEVVAAVFGLKPSTYMNHLTFRTYSENDDLMASIAAVTKNI